MHKLYSKNKFKSLCQEAIITLAVCFLCLPSISLGNGLGVNKVMGDSPSQYPGSQAFNNFFLLGEEVNPNTGSLVLSKSLVSLDGINKAVGINLSLTYSYSTQGGAQGVLGFPINWGLSIPYVIPGHSFTYAGRTSIIDNTWSDLKGYHSGLRYENNQGVKFKQVFPAQSLPSGNVGKYSYKATYGDGSHDYFDATGKLIEHDDRFGNHISYHYKNISGVFSNRLDYIIDSYGQKISFEYLENKIIIKLPSGGQKVITYTSKGVEYIEEELGNKTIFSYLRDASLINKIRYATGLETRIQYHSQGIAYKTASGTSYLPAVSDLIHQDLSSNKVLDHTNYTYGYSTTNTFTGFNAGYVLSQTKDEVMESDNTTYVYDVLIRKLDGDNKLLSATNLYFNYLHLPVKIDQYLVSNSGNLLGLFKPEVVNGYEIRYSYYVDPIAPGKHARNTNYAKPTVTEKLVWSPQDNKYIPVSKNVAGSCDSSGKLEPKYQGSDGYDDFGNLVTQSSFVYDSTQGKYIPQTNVANTYVQANWGEEKRELPETSKQTDLVTGYVKQTNFTLTADEKNISRVALQYKKNANQSWKPWKFSNYAYDNNGRCKSKAVKWASGSGYDPDSVVFSGVKYNYTYDSDSHSLKVQTTDALGYNSFGVYDTKLPGSPVISSENAAGEIESYVYDLVGRATKYTDPKGNSANIDYYFYGKDGFNGTITTEPLGYKKAQYVDALGRSIEIMDNGDPTKSSVGETNLNRILKKSTYNYLGAVEQEIDSLGLITKYSYDSLGRMIKTVDPLSNVYTVDYDDANLSVTYSVNGSKYRVEESDVNVNGNFTNTYTYPDSDDKSIDYSLKYATRYNGFGDPIAGTFSKINNTGAETSADLARITLSYNPDATVKTRNFIGLVDDRVSVAQNMVYDLSGQPMYYTKTVTYSDGRKYTFISDENVYDKVGNLYYQVDDLYQWKEFEYDSVGRLAKVTRYDQDGYEKGYNTYSYDKNGNVIELVYKDLLDLQHGSGKVTYEYYPNNLQKSITDATSSINYEYYLDGSLKTTKYSDDKEKSYKLDSYGRVIEVRDESDALTKFEYDSKGFLSSQSHKDDRLNYTYDTVNHVKGKLVAVGLTGQNAFTKNYTYNGFDRVSKESVINAQGRILLNSLYSHDVLGRMKTLEKSSIVSSTDTSVNLQRTFKYDGINQLLEEKTSYPSGQQNLINYKYDGKGNVLTKTTNGSIQNYEYDEIGQITYPTITYDHNGRITKDDLGFHYLYNGLDQLIQITDNVGKLVCNYSYYPDGLLMARSDATTNKHYYYQGAGTVNSILATDKLKNTSAWETFLFAGDGSRVSAYNTSQEKPLYYMTTNGSTAALLKDGVLQGLDYDPYGKAKNVPSLSQSDTSFLWNQEYYEANPGLVYLRSRFYNPRLMRFMTADSYPVENKYSFGNADPINMIDPSGHFSFAEFAIGVGEIAAGVAAAFIPGAGPYLSGALIGAGISGAIDGAKDGNGFEWGFRNAKDWGIDQAIGAATGAVGAAAFEVAAAGFNAATKFAGDIVKVTRHMGKYIGDEERTMLAVDRLRGLRVNPADDQLIGYYGAPADRGAELLNRQDKIFCTFFDEDSFSTGFYVSPEKDYARAYVKDSENSMLLKAYLPKKIYKNAIKKTWGTPGKYEDYATDINPNKHYKLRRTEMRIDTWAIGEYDRDITETRISPYLSQYLTFIVE